VQEQAIRGSSRCGEAGADQWVFGNILGAASTRTITCTSSIAAPRLAGAEGALRAHQSASSNDSRAGRRRCSSFDPEMGQPVKAWGGSGQGFEGNRTTAARPTRRQPVSSAATAASDGHLLKLPARDKFRQAVACYASAAATKCSRSTRCEVCRFDEKAKEAIRPQTDRKHTRRGDRQGKRQDQARLGRLLNKPDDTSLWQTTTPKRRWSSSSDPPVHCAEPPTTAWSTSGPRPNTASGLHQETASSWGQGNAGC